MRRNSPKKPTFNISRFFAILLAIVVVLSIAAPTMATAGPLVIRKEVELGTGASAPYDRYNFTLTLKDPDKTVEGTVRWEGEEGYTSKRPSSVTVELYGDGEQLKSTEVLGTKSENVWEYSFTNLPKYNDAGDEVVYTVKQVVEDDGFADEYATEISGYTITNTKTASYTVYYMNLEDNTEMAERYVGKGVKVGESVTETAPDFDGYDFVGYYREVTIEIGPSSHENTIVFFYEARPYYTVYYMDIKTNAELEDKKIVRNVEIGDVVTETAPDIDGYYLADENEQKQSITISTVPNENQIVFYYREGERPTYSSYGVHYIDKDTDEKVKSAFYKKAKVGERVTAVAPEIEGYTLFGENNEQSILISDIPHENTMVFYYKKNPAFYSSYTIYYVDEGDASKNLQDPVTEEGVKIGDTVTVSAPPIEGYINTRADEITQKIHADPSRNNIYFTYVEDKTTDIPSAYKIRYVDAKDSTMDVADPLIEKEDVFVGQYVTVKPPTIDGYELVDGVISKSFYVKEVEGDDLGNNTYTFTYRKLEAAEYSSYSVYYVDADTDEVLRSTRNEMDVVVGDTATETAPTIDGYKLLGEQEQTITIQKEAYKNTIIFTYENLAEPDPDPAYTSYTVYCMDDEWNAIKTVQVENILVGKTYRIVAPTIEGYEVQEPRVQTVTMGESDTTVMFYYTKTTDATAQKAEPKADPVKPNTEQAASAEFKAEQAAKTEAETNQALEIDKSASLVDILENSNLPMLPKEVDEASDQSVDAKDNTSAAPQEKEDVVADELGTEPASHSAQDVLTLLPMGKLNTSPFANTSGAPYEGPVQSSGGHNFTKIGAGEYTFDLKAGEEISLTGIPADVSYTVKENGGIRAGDSNIVDISRENVSVARDGVAEVYPSVVGVVQNGGTIVYTHRIPAIAQRYTVSYVGNGAEKDVPSDTNTYLAGNAVTVSSQEPVRKGYTFGGWLLDANGNIYSAGSTLTMPAQHITLTAQWEKIPTYTVHFDSQGGSAVAPIKDVEKDTTIAKPADPSYKDHTFKGWTKDSAGKQPWSFASDKVTSDMTLFAQWEKTQTYTVHFDSQGGSAVAPITGVKENTTITKPANPSYTGHTFKGWTRDSAGKQPWSFASDKVTSDMTLFAQWEKTQTPTPPTPTPDPDPDPTPTPDPVPTPRPPIPTPDPVPTPRPPTPTPDPDPTPRPPIPTPDPDDPTGPGTVTPQPSPGQETPGGDGADDEKPIAPAGVTDDDADTPPGAPVDYVKQNTETLEQIKEEGGPVIRLGDNEIPLSGIGYEGVWGLLNLILMIAGGIGAIVLLIGMFARSKQESEDEQRATRSKQTEEQEQSQSRAFVARLIGIIAGVAGILVFILTQNMNNLLVLIDKWTLLMAIIAIVEIIAAVFTRRKSKDTEVGEPIETGATV